MTTAVARRAEASPAEYAEELQRELNTPAMKAELAAAAEMIIGAYPHGRPDNPEAYVRAVTALLSSYPRFVVQAVADPRTGVITQCKYLPTVAELKVAADNLRQPKADELAHHRALAKQVEERREEPSEEDRAYVAERMDAFRNTLKANNTPDTQEPEKTVGEKLKELKGAPITPLPSQSQPGEYILKQLEAEKDG